MKYWIPVFTGMTEEKMGMTEEKMGMTEEKMGMTEEKMGMTEEKMGMTEENGGNLFPQAYAPVTKRIPGDYPSDTQA